MAQLPKDMKICIEKTGMVGRHLDVQTVEWQRVSHPASTRVPLDWKREEEAA